MPLFNTKLLCIILCLLCFLDLVKNCARFSHPPPPGTYIALGGLPFAGVPASIIFSGNSDEAFTYCFLILYFYEYYRIFLKGKLIIRGGF